MKKNWILLLFLYCSCHWVLAQTKIKDPFKPADSALYKIKVPIYRLLLTVPAITPNLEPDPMLMITMEHRVKKVFSWVGKIGVGAYIDNFSDSKPMSFNGLFTAEFRYYYNLKKRVRKEKKIFNFSLPFIALQEQVITNTFAVSGLPWSQSMGGSYRTNLNWGWQGQWKKLYYTIELGLSLGGGYFLNDNIEKARTIRGAWSIGWVF